MNKKFLILLLVFAIELEAIVYALLLDADTILSLKETLPSLDVPVAASLLVFIASLLVFILILSLRLATSTRITVKLGPVWVPTLTLAIILAVGIFLRLQLPPRHYQFYDEELYLHHAQMMIHSGAPTECTFGIFEGGRLNCLIFDGLVGGMRLENGYPLLLSGLFKLFGTTSETIAYTFNLLLGVANIVLVFFIGKALWSKSAGLFAASMVSVLPEHIWWTRTTDLEIPALFFLLSGLLAFILFRKSNHYYLFVLSSALIVFAAFIRAEIIVILPLIWTLLLFQRNLRRLLFKSWTNVALTIVVSFFTVANIVTTITNRFLFFKNELAAGITTFFSLQYFKENIPEIITYYLATRHVFMFLIGVAAIIGAFTLLKASWSRAVVFLGVPILLFSVYTSLLYGAYTQVNPLTIRYALIWMSLLTIVAGIGFDKILQVISRSLASKTKPEVVGAITILTFLIFSALYLLNHFTTFIPVTYASNVIMQRESSLAFQKVNPQCLYVNEFAPRDIFHGYSAISYEKFVTIEPEDKVLNKQQCVVFFKTQRCEEDFTDLCDQIFSTYTWKKLPYDQIDAWQLVSTSPKDIKLLIPKTQEPILEPLLNF